VDMSAGDRKKIQKSMVLLSYKKRRMQRSRLQTTRHDKEMRSDWWMPRPPEDCWPKSGASLLGSQRSSLAGRLLRVMARIMVIRDFLQALLDRSCLSDILWTVVRFLERSWEFSRFSHLPMCASRP